MRYCMVCRVLLQPWQTDACIAHADQVIHSAPEGPIPYALTPLTHQQIAEMMRLLDAIPDDRGGMK